MPKWVVYGAVWVAAAAAALVVAFWGVGIVGDQVTGERPAPLSATEVAARATSTTTSTTAPTTTTSTTAAPVAAPQTTSTAPPRSTTTVTSLPPAPAGETRTYNLVGGSTALRFSPSGVTVVWANPNPGFEVESEPENGNGVKVEFRGEEHRSRVDGWWDGGPQERVREEEDD